MTRTDVVASSRPQKADEATMRKGSPRARKLVVLSVAFALMMALVSPAAVFAAEETSPYTSKPPTTTTTTTPPPTTTSAPATPTSTPTPTSGTSPEKQSSTPEKSAAPETKKEEPTSTSAPTTTQKATSLPFTGFDLRWTIAAGIVLLATGFSIVTMQRRQRRSNGR
jgi:outer membrane biosynthesis protein TonB